MPITSEIRLLVKHLPNRLRTIGITGSAGKSTTTAMTAHILRKVLGQSGETPYGDRKVFTAGGQGAKALSKAKRQLPGAGVWMGGNIGGSLLTFVGLIGDDDWVVLELSSFMLEGLREDAWSPHVAVITNISPNHLDWHGSMENYVAAKRVVLDFQRPRDCFVFGPHVKDTLPPPRDGREGAIHDWSACDDDITPFFDESIGSPLPGPHNQVNAEIAAEACARTYLKTADHIGPGGLTKAAVWIQDFRGLRHRLEYVGEFVGIKTYNDSKSTTPEAARLAIESFDPGRVRIILGGYDKGSDFSELVALAAERCAGVYTIGAMGDGIADAVEAASRAGQTPTRPTTCGGVAWPEPGVAVERCGTLDVAVERAMRDAKPDDVVVLSPGCASWDQFANYEERGEVFKTLVKKYGETDSPD